MPAEQGYTNKNLSVEGVGGGVSVSAFTDAAARVTTELYKPSITYTYMANDPTPVIAAGNPGDAFAAFKEFFRVMVSSNRAHSCYGTGAAGCATIANPVAGGPVPINQKPENVITYKGGVLVSSEAR